MRYVLVLVLAIIGSGMVWIRVAPSDPAVWHRQPDAREPGDYPQTGGFEAVRRADGPNAVAALHEVILATPRTRVLDGSVEAGMMTYVTRSRIMGFPDYTTVTLRGDVVSIWGRLRFGNSDLGVNRARIEGWLAKVPGFSGP